MYIKELSELNGVSGDEGYIREFIGNKVKDLVDEIKTDSIGNLICLKKGKKSSKKILLAAHMDEVGFMVSDICEDGMIKFKIIGGIDTKVLPGKKVYIGKESIPGIIGILPIHLQSGKERDNVSIPLSDLYIDAGYNSKDSITNIKKGDYISFASRFVELNDKICKGKAFDDRAGCSLLIDLLHEDLELEYDLYIGYSVQEEIGLRGAQVLGYSVNPDIAIIVEGTTCSDVPDLKEHEYSTRLGKGAVLSIVDGTSYTDKKLLRYIEAKAKENKIEYQYKNTITGGNDAGMIQRAKGGAKTAVISVPVRYIHSPASLINIDDYKSAFNLIKCIIEGLGSTPCIDIENIINYSE